MDSASAVIGAIFSNFDDACNQCLLLFSGRRSRTRQNTHTNKNATKTILKRVTRGVVATASDCSTCSAALYAGRGQEPYPKYLSYLGDNIHTTQKRKIPIRENFHRSKGFSMFVYICHNQRWNWHRPQEGRIVYYKVTNAGGPLYRPCSFEFHYSGIKQ